MSDPLDNLLDGRREVSAILADDLNAAWAHLQAWGEGVTPGRLVTCRWEQIPSIDGVLVGVVRALSAIALADWPHWYGTVLSSDGDAFSAFERNSDLRENLREVGRRQIHVATTWLRRAAGQCLRNQSPFEDDGNLEVQAAQLSLAVCPDRLFIVLGVGPAATSDGAASLAAAAEWLHRVTGATVALLAPIAWRDSPGLARLPVSVLTFGARTDDGWCPGGLGTSPAQPIVDVTPLPGRPHPGSPAEQLLFARITADAELAPLLMFNQTVRVELNRHFRVDVMSSVRRVIVEVDGPDHRSSAAKYCADCERDYQLMKHGYLVLRLPNEVVLSDVAVAVERIRDILRYRKE